MPFLDHLEELRRRLLFGLAGLVPILAVSMLFGKTLLEWLLDIIKYQLRRNGLPGTMLSTGLLEAFGAYFRVSLVVALIIGAPWLLWQLWLFVAPGLLARERRFAYLLLPMSVVLSFLGLLFLYFVMLPVMLTFLITFGAGIGEEHPLTGPVPAFAFFPTLPVLDKDPDHPFRGQVWVNKSLLELRICIAGPEAVPAGTPAPSPVPTTATGDAPVPAVITPVAIVGTPLSRSVGMLQQYKVGDAVGFLMTTAVAFVLGFQAPIVVLLLGWAGIVDPKFLASKRKHAIFGCAIAAAILAPSADPLSMILLMIPLILLYELGMILLRLLPAERVARGLSKRGEPADAGDE
jgi:Sec-independent protein secretion pathway component TatC